jgi:hypothetical protein
MKIPITDKFLWDVYKLASEAHDLYKEIFITDLRIKSLLSGPENPLFKKYRKERGIKNFAKLIYYLKKKGYIKIENLQGKQGMILTKNGIGKALKASFQIEGKKKRPDGKWVMVIFDVPINRRKSRDLLREILINLGYKLLQQSVWVSPYNVSSKTEELLQFYLLDNFVKIFLIEEI